MVASSQSAARVTWFKEVKVNIYTHVFFNELYIKLLNTQCLQNSAESGERSVLTLGFLCLPYCVRDTA